MGKLDVACVVKGELLHRCNVNDAVNYYITVGSILLYSSPSITAVATVPASSSAASHVLAAFAACLVTLNENQWLLRADTSLLTLNNNSK